MSDRILVTGAAGFIGAHTAMALAKRGRAVVGLDNYNNYYDPELKRRRVEWATRQAPFEVLACDVTDHERLAAIFADYGVTSVIHLAAQAGVRYSLENPRAYAQSNLVGFLNVLECCRQFKTKHLVFASTSSVYGLNGQFPLSEHAGAAHPLTLYAASKLANEHMAHAYSHMFGLPVTGLRFFTVYGPWGRPDMAYFMFTKAIVDGTPIDVYDNGDMKRDFTFIDDVVEGIVRIAAIPPSASAWDPVRADPAASSAPYRILNIGREEQVSVREMVDILERHIGKPAIVRNAVASRGDVRATLATSADLERLTAFRPSTSLNEGLGQFVDWYRAYTAT
jgi:UDP-glucuronate 4-epimerase